MFKIINAIKIQEEIHTDGHSPLRIFGDDFKDYIVKNDKGHNPPVCILNEIFANQFLNEWKISTPTMALMNVNIDLLEDNQLSINHKPSFYSKYPCFASEYINYIYEVNQLIINQSKEVFNKIENPLDIFRITLFDTWVENDDRKPSNYNLLFAPNNGKFKILAIDNAFIFSSLSYNHLNYTEASVSVNDHLLVSDLGFLVKKYYPIDQDFIKAEREYFYFCVQKCQKNFNTIAQNIKLIYKVEDETIETLKTFLFNKERNKNVFDEYIYRINQ